MVGLAVVHPARITAIIPNHPRALKAKGPGATGGAEPSAKKVMLQGILNKQHTINWQLSMSYNALHTFLLQ